jgi:hypothetical protein
MMPILPWPIVALFLLLHALAGMAIGAITGWVFCLVAKIRPRALVADLFLGTVGYLAGFTACVLVWPKNTMTYGTGPNPEWAAVVGAALLPLLNELYRRKTRGNTSFRRRKTTCYIEIVREITIDICCPTRWERFRIGKFTRENVRTWLENHTHGLDAGFWPVDFHAVCGDLDIPWETKEGRECWERYHATHGY